MREDSRHCTIAASPEVVWDHLADYGNVACLVGPGSGAELVSGSHGVPGAEYAVTILWEGLHSKFPTVLQEAERPRLLLYSGVATGSSGWLRFEVEPSGAGGSLVTTTVALALDGSVAPLEPFGWALATRMVERVMRKLEATLSATH